MKGGTWALYPGTTGTGRARRQGKADKVTRHCVTALIGSAPGSLSGTEKSSKFICTLFIVFYRCFQWIKKMHTPLVFPFKWPNRVL